MRRMIGMTVCSGIGAPEVAAPWIDWRWQSEIEPFPSAVLAHRFPDAVNLGDMTRFQEWPDADVDVLCGGTPCQSFSVAGLREGLDDPRGNLMLTYISIARRYRPRWVVWENVPGVLSSNRGWDFGAFLRGLGECGYGFAYRVLDAQFVRARGFERAVPQRRRRVFVVGYLGDWRRAAAVLFDGESLRGNPPPRREAGKAAPTIPSRSSAGGGLGTDFDCDGGLIASTGDVAHCLNAGGMGRQDYETETMIAHTLRGEGFDASEDGTRRGTPIVPMVTDTLVSNGDAHSGFRDEKGILPVAVHETHPTLCREPGGPGSQDLQMHAAVLAPSRETMYGVSHADAAQTGPDQALRALREAVGEKAYSEWGSGVVAALRAQEVLRSDVHGKCVRGEIDQRSELGDNALSRSEGGSVWTVRTLWEAGGNGRPPSRWKPSEQLARELGAHLSLLPHSRASASRFLLGLWRASEGLGLLRQALSAVQDAWRSADDQGEPAHSRWAVRRLTPTEAERLQGFPDDWTRIPYRNKPADQCPDGPRYKALGNSWAVNCGRWIFDRIRDVDAMEIAA